MRGINSLKRAALLIIDMSNEQVYTGGDTVYKGKTVIKNIQLLAQHFPKELILDSRLHFLPRDPSTLFQLYPELGVAGSSSSDLIAPLKMFPTTFIPKLQYSCFYGSTLDSYLKEQKVEHIYLTGINTDYCVFLTAMDAFYRNYTTTLVEDACSTMNGEAVDAASREHYLKCVLKFGEVLTSAEVLESMGC